MEKSSEFPERPIPLKEYQILTEEDVINMNRFLLTQTVSPLKLHFYINYDFENQKKYAIWFFVRKNNRITGAMSYDRRSNFVNLFMSQPLEFEPLMKNIEYSPEPTDELNGTKFSLVFGSLADSLALLLRAHWEAKGISKASDEGFETYRLDDVRALNDAVQDLDAGSEFYLDSCNLNDLDAINSTWKYRNSHSEYSLRWLLQHFPTSCLRRKVDNVPISWILTKIDGTIGNLYTHQEYRGRGFGKLVVKHLVSQLLAMAPMDEECLRGDYISPRPYCYISQENDSSRAMFTKIGFKKLHENHFWLKH